MNAFAMVSGILGIVGFALAVRAIVAVGCLQKRIATLEQEGNANE